MVDAISLSINSPLLAYVPLELHCLIGPLVSNGTYYLVLSVSLFNGITGWRNKQAFQKSNMGSSYFSIRIYIQPHNKIIWRWQKKEKKQKEEKKDI